MNKRSDKQVLADLSQVAAESQQALIGTLEEIQWELQPEVQINHFTERAKYEATKVWYSILDVVDAARAGDPVARQQVMQIAGGTVAVLAALRFRKTRKKKKAAKDAAKIATAAMAEADRAAVRAEELAKKAKAPSRRAKRKAKKLDKRAAKTAKRTAKKTAKVEKKTARKAAKAAKKTAKTAK